jgi:hypothetical protein
MNSDQLLNNFPKFSPWPLRLLGLEPWESKRKIDSEILREYEDEKWGPLWERVCASDSSISFDQLEEWVYGEPSESPCLIGGTLRLLSADESRIKQLEIVQETLSELLPASALVELGAGYGHIIMNLARNLRTSGIPLLAGEYTSSGVELLRYFAEQEKIDMIVGSCDFGKTPITDLNIPEDALCFTSYSACYIPEYSLRFVENMLSWSPKAVVHFEPIFEHCDTSTMLGAMQQRYIEVNDYNRNLLTVLKDAEKNGLIEILFERPHLFGSNPLLPISIVAWQPLTPGNSK